MRLATLATIVKCILGARVGNVKLNLKMLATVAVKTPDYSNRRSLKLMLSQCVHLLNTILDFVIFSGTLPSPTSDCMFSCMSSFNLFHGWLLTSCPTNTVVFGRVSEKDLV